MYIYFMYTYILHNTYYFVFLYSSFACL